MLQQLTISNFAIIDHLEIQFKPCLNILSGETGAGKSVIINAVNLILGGRALTDLIRTGCDEARVEALFSLHENPSLGSLLSDLGCPFDGELLVKRTISHEGRNKVTLNGSMATLQMLSRLGPMLLSISGQHEHQRLLRPENHLYLLDDFGDLVRERLKFNEAFSDHQALKAKRAPLEGHIRFGEEKRELTKFQIGEIQSANIREGEDLLLEEERRRLLHAEEQKEILTGAYEWLYEKDNAILSALSQCIKRIEKGSEVDRRFLPIVKALDSARIEIEEAALELRALQDRITVEPGRLEEAEERLEVLNHLKRKYGPSLTDVMNFLEDLNALSDDLERKKKELEELDTELEAMAKKMLSMATTLSRRRKEAAKELEKSAKAEMELLGMPGTQFEVRFEPRKEMTPDNESPDPAAEFKTDGFDRVEFMLSPNPGEELRPLARIASGGELSRLMLALKTILARNASVETIVFDEIDSGIGGATAEVVGEKLQALAQYHQILCITHLPQIACKGSTHFRVEKRVVDGRTQTLISELDQQGRIREIARLMGGKVISEQAMAHAREILNRAYENLANSSP
jgi:DNA repair protein RecN (Recombination protein N)